MSKQKHQGGVKKRLQEQEATFARQMSLLKESNSEFKAKKRRKESEINFESIAYSMAINFKFSGQEPVRAVSEVGRTFKTKDPGKLRLAAARHLYGKYKVPAFLEKCWELDYPKAADNYAVYGRRYGRRYLQQEQRQQIADAEITTEELTEQRLWYIEAASGKSLYKGSAKGLLSRQEVHAFLNCPIKVTFRQAILYAIAKQHTDDLGVLTRVINTSLRNKPGQTWLKTPTWREVIRFFCTNEIELSEMNNLIDYFNHKVEQARVGEHYSLKGRTIESLRRQMQDWHWELARVKRLGNSKWEGLRYPNDQFTADGFEWKITQLTTSKELAAEGTAMHHCVYSYQQRCITGSIGIYGVRKIEVDCKEYLEHKRALTLEVTYTGEIIQIRGFGNRAAKTVERNAVNIWAKKNNLTISKYV